MKYVIANDEGDFEAGSDDKVLKNKLGIQSEQDMIDAENFLLLKLYEHLFEPELSLDDVTFETIQQWHRNWLGNVYGWAGDLRCVNVSKGGFNFAGAAQLPKLVTAYSQKFLTRFKALESFEQDELVSFLAASHIEFILIHPFREGNGRLSRLLMDIFVTKAGYGPLDYSLIDLHKDFYFKSIQAGVVGEYQHLEKLLADVLKHSDL